MRAPYQLLISKDAERPIPMLVAKDQPLPLLRCQLGPLVDDDCRSEDWEFVSAKAILELSYALRIAQREASVAMSARKQGQLDCQIDHPIQERRLVLHDPRVPARHLLLGNAETLRLAEGLGIERQR